MSDEGHATLPAGHREAFLREDSSDVVGGIAPEVRKGVFAGMRDRLRVVVFGTKGETSEAGIGGVPANPTPVPPTPKIPAKTPAEQIEWWTNKGLEADSQIEAYTNSNTLLNEEITRLKIDARKLDPSSPGWNGKIMRVREEVRAKEALVKQNEQGMVEAIELKKVATNWVTQLNKKMKPNIWAGVRDMVESSKDTIEQGAGSEAPTSSEIKDWQTGPQTNLEDGYEAFGQTEEYDPAVQDDMSKFLSELADMPFADGQVSSEAEAGEVPQDDHSRQVVRM